MSRCTNCGTPVTLGTNVEWCLECAGHVYECPRCGEVKDIRSEKPRYSKGEAPSGLPMLLCVSCERKIDGVVYENR